MAKLIRRIISTVDSPKPVGPYNQAVQVGQTVYLSGCLGMDKCTNKIVSGGAAAEAEVAITNIQAILKAADSCLSNVIKSTIYLEDINDFAAVNDIYKKFFKEPYPARSTFQVGKLPLGAKIEIEVIAISGPLETLP